MKTMKTITKKKTIAIFPTMPPRRMMRTLLTKIQHQMWIPQRTSLTATQPKRETFLKTAPKGFPKDFPYMQYLKCKDYTCTCPVDDSFFLEGDVLENIETAFRQLKRFGDFINDTIDEFE